MLNTHSARATAPRRELKQSACTVCIKSLLLHSLMCEETQFLWEWRRIFYMCNVIKCYEGEYIRHTLFIHAHAACCHERTAKVWYMHINFDFFFLLVWKVMLCICEVRYKLCISQWINAFNRHSTRHKFPLSWTHFEWKRLETHFSPEQQIMNWLKMIRKVLL